MNKRKGLGKGLRYVKHVMLFKIAGFFRTKIAVYANPNLKNLRKIKNSAKRKRCFIVATGPSLIKEDLELLEDEVTFGVNSIFLMYDKTDWRPTYYVCTDAGYFKKIYDEYHFDIANLSKKDIFLNRASKKIVVAGKKVHYIAFSNWNRVYDFEDYQFTEDVVHGLYAFGTVTNIVMAIAMYMGFEEIYLIGADCSNLNQHFVNDVTDREKTDSYVDKNVQIQIKGYTAMNKETGKRGIRVYNATRGGALEIFKRVALEDVLKIKENDNESNRSYTSKI